ncbi:PINc/VapC family ATPase [archaeon]|nr:PINc/VapC family ATPase [archaeon]
MPKKILIPDTSVIIDGRIGPLIDKYTDVRVSIHEAVVAELEAQANAGRDSGFKGLEELELLQKYASEGKIELDFIGERPTEAELKDIDDIIRSSSKKTGTHLVTSDKIQARIAQAKGISVIYLEKKKLEREPKIYDYFTDDTMSIHLRDRNLPKAKKGRPGDAKLVELSKTPMKERELKKLASEILEFSRSDPDSFIEIERRGATVVQMRELRISITYPPFSDAFEITAVRPVADMNLDDYKLSEKLLKRLKEKAEGILVAGPPGAGKSTFSGALAEFYKNQEKIVKTMESPRDLMISDEITQYGPLEGDMEKTADILLLVRPDYTIYDEVRKTKDFLIFADMRLAGVGMVGVVHAAKGIDAIQRLVGRVELGMIPQIVDTVVFIKDGEIKKVYTLKFTVKVPAGMMEADLARPVIEIKDFESGSVEFEIYTFGDETIVMPALDEGGSAIDNIAAQTIAGEIKKITRGGYVEVKVRGSKATVLVDEHQIPKIIGRHGENIEKIERRTGFKINIRSFDETSFEKPKEEFEALVREEQRFVVLKVAKELSGETIEAYAEDTYLFTATVGKNGEMKIGAKTKIGAGVVDAFVAGKKITIRKVP